MKFYKRVAIATLFVLQVIGAHAIDGYDLWLRMPMVTDGAKVTIDNPQIPETGNFDPQFAPIAISRSELNTFLHNTGCISCWCALWCLPPASSPADGTSA